MTSPTIPVTETDNARNINVWKDAEVYVSTASDPKIGADGSFDPAVWSFFGLLNEGSEIGQELDVERNDINSFGRNLQLKDVRFNKDTRTVTALEETETNFRILWPGSEWNPNGATVLMAPQNAARVFAAFKTVNSFGDVLIDVSREKAFAFSSGAGKTDDGASTQEFTFEVPKGDDGGLYDELRIRAKDGVTTSPLQPIRIESGTTSTGAVTSTFSLEGATGGQYAIVVGGGSTGGIAYNASAAEVQAEIRDISGQSGATVTGDYTAGFTITGTTTKAAVDATSLTGGTFPKEVTVS